MVEDSRDDLQVVPYLRDELLDRVELQLIPHAFDQGHGDLSAVQVTVEPDDVCLEQRLKVVPERGPHADADCRRHSIEPAGIYAETRKRFLVQEDVGGWKADDAASLVTVYHRPTHRYRIIRPRRRSVMCPGQCLRSTVRPKAGCFRVCAAARAGAWSRAGAAPRSAWAGFRAE